MNSQLQVEVKKKEKKETVPITEVIKFMSQGIDSKKPLNWCK